MEDREREKEADELQRNRVMGYWEEDGGGG